MAEEDIYGNKRKCERCEANLEEFAKLPHQRRAELKHHGAKYWCKNKVNLKYFRMLFDVFDAEDQSYIRRYRMLGSFRVICHCAEKDLKDCDRPDINKIVAFARTVYNPRMQASFIKDMKYAWKKILPEKDERGRIDETLVPYPVRHLSIRIDKSRERMRKDKLTWDEFERIVGFFANDVRIQAYLTLAVESLGRPQEMFYRRISDVALFDNYAKIWISDHGKEGTGFLQCIDSFPYLLKWLNQHPLQSDKDAFLFINLGAKREGEQLTPFTVNKKLKKACKVLGIDKPITCYSLKRNGVTFRRLRGDSDMQIQHAARWTSTKQLKTYDLSIQDDAFKIELAKRGLSGGEKAVQPKFNVRECSFCGQKQGMTEEICTTCLRPLDRNKIRKEAEENEVEVVRLRQHVAQMEKKFDVLLEQLKHNAYATITEKLKMG